jgi:cyclopropane fatty-acyl-phospholipid synthase-like methyltransferase
VPRTSAIDIGCAVGGASFHLAAHFDTVLGVDFSQSFVNAANMMKVPRELYRDCGSEL